LSALQRGRWLKVFDNGERRLTDVEQRFHDAHIREVLEQIGEELTSVRAAHEFVGDPALNDQWTDRIYDTVRSLSPHDRDRALVLLLWDNRAWRTQSDQVMDGIRAVTR
jgi:hypothetical protein